MSLSEPASIVECCPKGKRNEKTKAAAAQWPRSSCAVAVAKQAAAYVCMYVCMYVYPEGMTTKTTITHSETKKWPFYRISLKFINYLFICLPKWNDVAAESRFAFRHLLPSPSSANVTRLYKCTHTYIHTYGCICVHIHVQASELISIAVYLYLIYESASYCLFAVWQLIWVSLIASEMSLLYSLTVRAHGLYATYIHTHTHAHMCLCICRLFIISISHFFCLCFFGSFECMRRICIAALIL